MKLNIAVDKRITELCLANKVTRYKLAKRGGIYDSTLSQIKKCQTVTLETIKAICDTLEISLNEFFDSPLFDRSNIED